MKENKNIFTIPAFATFIALFCWTAWGTGFPLNLKCYQLFEISGISDSFVFGGTRLVFAGLMLLIFFSVKERKLQIPQKEEVPRLVLLGTAQTGLVYVTQYIALNYCSGTHCSIINSLQPAFMTLFAHFLFRNDKISWRKIFGIIIGFAGVLIALKNKESFKFTLKGEGMIAMSSILFAFGSNLSKIVTGKIPASITSGYNLLVGGTEVLIIGLICNGHLNWSSLTGIALLTVLSLIASVCYLLWTSVCSVNPIGRLAPMQFINPITGTVLSAVILGENAFQPRYFISLAMVSASIIITTASFGKTEKKYQ